MPFLLIAINACMELLRQPASLLVLFGTTAFIGVSSNVYYFGFGDDARLVKNMVLAMIFLAGLFSVVFGASSTLAREIRTGTALTVLAKPVGRTEFLLAKFTGLAAAIGAQMSILTLAALLASRMAFDAHGAPDKLAAGCYFGALLAALAYGAATNYFAERPFISDSTAALALLLGLVFLGINFIDRDGHSQKWGSEIDWRLVPSGVLLWMALIVLAAIALACTTRLDVAPTLAICSAIFLLGLMSDYLLGRAASGGSTWARVAYAIVPNWQLFWTADALATGKTIPWAYVAATAGYAGCFLTSILSLAVLSFRTRELAG